jgi:sodium-dependent dicarboxylate transporter 2/3/5
MLKRCVAGLLSLFRRKDGFNYGLLLLAVAFFLLMTFKPVPSSFVKLVSKERPVGYGLQGGTKTITESVNKLLKTKLSPEQVARKAVIMTAVLFTAAFLWATEAIPLGATDLLVGGILYVFSILPWDDIAQAYMKDAVFFIAGVLTIAVGVSTTGLDRRISVLILGRVRSLRAFCFVFLPALAVLAGFFSAHALTAILIPILVRSYAQLCEHHHVKFDRYLAVTLVLGICFAMNQGGPGSPAAGGRNAVMVGYLNDFGLPISFAQWMLIAMPYVLFISLIVGAFLYIIVRKRIKVPAVNLAELLKSETNRNGPMTRREGLMAIILACVVLLWIFASNLFGLGGPCVFGVILMLIFRIITWKDIQTHVRFDVVGMYAAACAMGVGLKMTGASLWLAEGLINLLPDYMRQGDALIMAISAFAVLMTNFMSDGATVAAIGPVALSMAVVGKVHVWKVGLACAFSSSFANTTIVGTPNNAIAYVGAVDPRTGERLVRLRDFLIYGIPVTLIATLALWAWAILGYWKWLPWPSP